MILLIWIFFGSAKKNVEVYDAFSDFEEEIIETKSPDNSFEGHKGCFGKLSTWFKSPGSVTLVKTFIRAGLVIVHCPVGGGVVIKSSFPTKIDGQSSWHQGLLLLATECDVCVALTCSWNL